MTSILPLAMQTIVVLLLLIQVMIESISRICSANQWQELYHVERLAIINGLSMTYNKTGLGKDLGIANWVTDYIDDMESCFPQKGWLVRVRESFDDFQSGFFANKVYSFLD